MSILYCMSDTQGTYGQLGTRMTSADYLSRGHRLQAAILTSGYNQSELAQRLGISRQALSDIVKGRAPGEKHVHLLAELLGVPEEWLRDGGEIPDCIMDRLERAKDNMPVAVKIFQEILLKGRTLWHELKHRTPNKFDELIKQLEPGMQHLLSVDPCIPRRVPRHEEDIRAAFSMVDYNIEPENLAAFQEGHKYLYGLTDVKDAIRKVDRASSESRPATDLPMEQFNIIRGALLVLRAERHAFGRSSQDIDRTLALMWRRQLAGAWPMQTLRRLREQRVEDLGPDLDADIEAGDAVDTNGKGVEKGRSGQ